MGSPTVFAARESTFVDRFHAQPLQDNLQEFVEAPGMRGRSARGAILGVVLGAGLWGAILTAVGVIKL